MSTFKKIEKNAQGQVTYYQYSNGFEEWWVYNEQGQEIHFKDSNGYEVWKEYNAQSQVIHRKDSRLS